MSLKKLQEEKILKGSVWNKDRKRSGKYNPSQFGRCYRLQLFNRLNIEPTNPMPVSTLKNGRSGTATHNLNQEELPKNICEVVIETEHFSGRADIVTEDTVYDIKSQNEWKIKRYWNKPVEVLLKDKKEAFLQTGWYDLQLKKPFICVLAIPFGTFIEKEYPILTEVVRKEIELEERTLIDNWLEYQVSGKLPEPKPRAFGGKGCIYCQWADHCTVLETNTDIQAKEAKDGH